MLVVIEHYLSKAGIGIYDEEGQGLVEYVLIIALIAILLVGGLALVQVALDGRFTAIDAVV